MNMMHRSFKIILFVSLLVIGGCASNDKQNNFTTSASTVNELNQESDIDIHAVDSDGNRALHVAAHKQYLGRVMLLIEKGANVNAQNQQGKTALMMTDDDKVASALIQAGADVNIRDNEGKTALMLTKDGETALALVRAGADVNVVDSNGISAYTYALGHNYFRRDELLREMNPDPRFVIPEDAGEKSLIWAIEKENNKLVEQLIQSGSDVNIKNDIHTLGLTPLMVAARKHNVDIVRLLLEHGAKVNDKTEDGMTALEYGYDYLGPYEATALKDANMIGEFLVSKGADIHHFSRKNPGILYLVVKSGDVDFVKKLISLDASLVKNSDNGSNPELKLAFTQLEEAIEDNLNVKCHNDRKYSPACHSDEPHIKAVGDNEIDEDLNRIEEEIKEEIKEELDFLNKNIKQVEKSISNYKSIIELLTNAGAKLTKEGCSELLSFTNQTEIVRLLLERYGADPNQNYKNQNYSPLRHAIDIKNPEMMKLLIEAGAESNRFELGFASLRHGNDKTLEVLLKNGLDTEITITDEIREILPGQNINATLLMIAAMMGNGYLEVMPNRYHGTGHHDVIGPHEFDSYRMQISNTQIQKCIQLLIKYGAKVNAQDYHGMTALFYAVDGHSPETIKLLLKNGANKNLKTTWDETVLDYAMDSDCPECVRALGGTPVKKSEDDDDDDYDDNNHHRGIGRPPIVQSNERKPKKHEILVF